MVSSVFVSNYELLVKPIIDAPTAPNRTIIQGYFLTLSNPITNGFTTLTIDLNFSGNIPITLPGQTPRVLGFFDSRGTNTEIPQERPNSTNNTYRITLGPRNTGLFLLQPNILIDGVVEERDVEIRGLVRMTLVSAEPIFGPAPDLSAFSIVLSAQQRGTFLPQGNTAPPNTGDYDQLAYDLPLATPSALVELEPEVPITSSSTLPNSTRLMETFERFPELLDGIGDRSLAEVVRSLPLNIQQEVLDSLEAADAIEADVLVRN
jgi:hypothetical protein